MGVDPKARRKRSGVVAQAPVLTEAILADAAVVCACDGRRDPFPSVLCADPNQ